MNNDVNTIVSTYDVKEEHGRSRRRRRVNHASSLVHNWIKATLIQRYCPKNAVVFDMAGGKGGDLIKYGHVPIASLLLADFSKISVQQAAQRYIDLRCGFRGRFVYGDCYHPHFTFKLDAFSCQFDTVFCNFALHYAFESETRARQALFNAAYKLKSGGHFVITVPDADELVSRLRSARMRRHGNTAYSVLFDQCKSVVMKKRDQCGVRYMFELRDAVAPTPEYLVSSRLLVAYAKEASLKLIKTLPFSRFEKDFANTDADVTLYRRMGCKTLDSVQSQVRDLYVTFVFEKL